MKLFWSKNSVIIFLILSTVILSLLIYTLCKILDESCEEIVGVSGSIDIYQSEYNYPSLTYDKESLEPAPMMDIIIDSPKVHVQVLPLELMSLNSERVPVYYASDVIDYIEVKIYNHNSTGFNKEDANLYFKDILRVLNRYDMRGIWKSALLAQSYTEGGAGKRGVYTKTNNMFGIKAGPLWRGYVYSRDQGRIFINYDEAMKHGATDLFRAYESIAESIEDYMILIRGSYSESLNTQSPVEYLEILLQNEYGSSYMLEVWRYVINLYDLTQYD